MSEIKRCGDCMDLDCPSKGRYRDMACEEFIPYPKSFMDWYTENRTAQSDKYSFDDVHLAWKAGISCKQTEIESLQAKIKELESIIEKQKTCETCNKDFSSDCVGCDGFSKWEFRE